MRSWRSALETINYHNAYRLSSTFTPKTETEKALSDSIRQLESQCRERVDLLEALRVSRNEAQDNNEDGGETNGISTPTTPTSTHRRSSSSFLKSKFGSKSSPSNKSNGKSHNRQNSNTTLSGWIGEGTIPAVDYADLSKPPPLPGRPAPQTRIGSEAIVNNDNKNNVQRADSGSNSAFAVRGQSDSPAKPQSRSSSTEKQAPMLSTLRNKDPKKQAKKKVSPKRKDKDQETRPAASQAAGLAWDNIYRSPSSDKTASDVALASSRHSFSSDGFRKDPQDSRTYSGDELSSRRNLDDPDDQIPTSHWRDPRASDKAVRRVPVKTPVTISSAAPGGGRSHSGSRNRSSSSASATKDTVPPRSSPKPSVKPKPAELRALYPEFNGTGSVPGTPRYSRNPNATSKPVSRAGKDYIPYSPGIADDGGISDSMNRMDISNQNLARRRPQAKSRETPPSSDPESSGPRSTEPEDIEDDEEDEEDEIMDVLNRLPKGVDVMAARQILNDIVVRGDEVHWNDIAGLEGAKKALKEAVVYPFLRPDLFSGLREPARGMLLFGPPGTGKTMLARAVATESKSTFFSVSASTLTSKWHGESEKLVRALFGLAKALAPSIIFVDEIDSLLSARSSGSENEASRRSKTEFLIQWSDLQRAAAGREQPGKESKKLGDPSRVLVLAATNMPWDIDEAARRRFVRRQYIPLPEHEVRKQQLQKLLSHQVYELSDDDIEVLVQVTEGKFSLQILSCLLNVC